MSDGGSRRRPVPDLPEAAHSTVDSMLARRFGKEVANYFSGSPLNRVSFLRSDATFLSQALRHDTSRFILFKELNPLVVSSERLAFASYKDVEPIVGNPYTASEEDLIKQYTSAIYVPQLVFLGLDESEKGHVFAYKECYSGQPHWALDVTPHPSMGSAVEALIEKVEGEGLYFAQGRMQLSLVAPQAAMYAEGRHVLDWNLRSPYCASCGHRTLSTHGGFKRTCPPRDLAGRDRPACATRAGASNLSFPRTDPTVIMAVVSHDGRRIMLGRQRRWPPHWYSTLAGFLEPAESIEEAVRREVWEESGVRLGRVVIHSTQPWPYPANLMVGAVAQAVPDGETIHLGHDAELDDARWFGFEEVKEALASGTSGLGEDPGPDYKPGALRLPPLTAIAHQLMRAVVLDGFVGTSPKI